MARGRMISRSLGTSSEKFARLRVDHPAVGLFAQALYPLLVANADDFGRQKGDAFTVKHSVWSTAPEAQPTFDAALNAMAAVGLIVRYTAADGGRCLQIVQFDPHQQGLHKRTVSQFPEPPGNSGNVGNAPVIPSELNLTEPNLTEPKRKEPRACARDAESVLEERFDRFWGRYPNKEGRKSALAVWLKMAPSEAVTNQIIASVEAHRRTQRWEKAITSRDLTFVKLAKNWLDEALWMESPPPVPTGGPTTCRHRHTPPCENEADCTSKYLAALEAGGQTAAVAVPA